MADTDGDEAVDREESFAFQHGHFPALTRQAAGEAFRRLDRDGDGTLSREEFIGGMVEFWTSPATSSSVRRAITATRPPKPNAQIRPDTRTGAMGLVRPSG
ncbi:EF-hand domain-containing protein [Streptomyces inusitatus]|uniref:EF-hand domain-containing protein n=1 Tax=Streptomyces inusitatus TaxID=68221 RepID=UPI001E594854|nr:EF-hand domain-containing protein [Streptomyces inusitatus]